MREYIPKIFALYTHALATGPLALYISFLICISTLVEKARGITFRAKTVAEKFFFFYYYYFLFKGVEVYMYMYTDEKRERESEIEAKPELDNRKKRAGRFVWQRLR